MEVVNTNQSPDKYSRKGTHNNNYRERPRHPLLFNVAVNPARNRHNVVDQICRTNRGAGKTKDAHLKRKEQKCAGDAAHGSKEGDNKGDRQEN